MKPPTKHETNCTLQQNLVLNMKGTSANNSSNGFHKQAEKFQNNYEIGFGTCPGSGRPVPPCGGTTLNPFKRNLGLFEVCGVPTRFWRGAQIDHFRTKSFLNQKKVSPGKRLEKHDFGKGFWCQNGRHWEATSISHYTCCNLRVFAGSWNLM